MATGSSDDEILSTATLVAQQLSYKQMKAEQLQVITYILKGYDVFAILPTGFGKTLCFASLPYLFDRLLPVREPSIVVVVTPLTAIMKDQASLLATVVLINIAIS